MGGDKRTPWKIYESSYVIPCNILREASSSRYLIRDLLIYGEVDPKRAVFNIWFTLIICNTIVLEEYGCLPQSRKKEIIPDSKLTPWSKCCQNLRLQKQYLMSEGHVYVEDYKQQYRWNAQQIRLERCQNIYTGRPNHKWNKKIQSNWT